MVLNFAVKVLRLFAAVSVALSSPTGRSTTGPEVKTNKGRIRGFVQIVEGVTVNTFLGVPFAEPPVGDLRFKPPVPVNDWNETLEADQMPNSCPQQLYNYFPGNPGEDMWNPKTERNEDCLYLNIWVPLIHEDHGSGERLTTMLWIFGGGFVAGSASLDIYEGHVLAATTGVIVVTVNYRLGPFGFLYLANADAPGNMGLMDQNLALKWIHENIQQFGGDEKKICLFGESAGATSVHYHIMSPESNEYFSTAILQSGSTLAPWAYREPVDAYRISREFSELVGCEQTDVRDLVHCLRQVEAHTLSAEQWNLQLRWTFSTFPFIPTRDGHFIKNRPEFNVHHANYTRKPLLLGVDKDEYTFWIIYGMAGQMDLETGQITESEYRAKIPLTVDPQIPHVVKTAILNQYDSYFPASKRPTHMQLLDSIGGDFNFKCPTIEVAEEAVRHKDHPPVYVYSYEHRASNNPWPSWSGVLHGDEIEFIFGVPLKEGTNFTAEEKEFSIQMMSFWANFAKTGNPNGCTQEHSSAEQQGFEVISLVSQRMMRDTSAVEKHRIQKVNEVANDKRSTVTVQKAVDNLIDSAKERNQNSNTDQVSIEQTSRNIVEPTTLNVQEIVSQTDAHTTVKPESHRVKDSMQLSMELNVLSGTKVNQLWDQYERGEEKYLILKSGDHFTTESGLRHKECKFWNVLYRELRDVTTHCTK